jgi:hypothetical protein
MAIFSSTAQNQTAVREKKSVKFFVTDFAEILTQCLYWYGNCYLLI